MQRRQSGWRATSSGVLALVVGVALAGCSVGASTSPSPTASSTTPASGATSGTPTPHAGSAPTLIADGTAKANLPYFDYVNKQLITRLGTPHGRDFIDNLVASGFAKANMEVTPDTTSVGLNADNIQFSVKFDGACLIGQYGDVGYVGIVTTVLGTGKCLIGKTRPIDW